MYMVAKDGKRISADCYWPMIIDAKQSTHTEIYNRTDAGNALRFADIHYNDVMFCPADKMWYCYDGTRWAPDRTEAVMRLCLETVKEMDKELETITDEKEHGFFKKYILHCESLNKLKAMAKIARSDERIVVEPDKMDQDQYLLNLLNGTFDLSTHTFREHNKRDWITKLAPVKYDLEAECPRWIRFLDEIFMGDRELISFIQRAVGYSISGDTSEECFFALHGDGANGKSTLMGHIQHILGDYARQCESSTILKKTHEGVSNDIARLRGARFVVVNESAVGAKLNEDRIKELTGNDVISARFLYHETFEFRPRFKLWWRFNHRPEISDATDSIWRRIHYIPFERDFKGDDIDRTINETLYEEASGILNWALMGYEWFERDGLIPPNIVTTATEEYREEEDELKPFIDECCDLKENVDVRATDLYTRYKSWAHENSIRIWSRTQFGKTLGERLKLYSIKKKRDEKGYYYLGIRPTWYDKENGFQ